MAIGAVLESRINKGTLGRFDNDPCGCGAGRSNESFVLATFTSRFGLILCLSPTSVNVVLTVLLDALFLLLLLPPVTPASDDTTIELEPLLLQEL